METPITEAVATTPAHTSDRITHPDEQEFDRNFKPRGAIAFFILLVIFGLTLWFSIYFLMLERV